MNMSNSNPARRIARKFCYYFIGINFFSQDQFYFIPITYLPLPRYKISSRATVIESGKKKINEI